MTPNQCPVCERAFKTEHALHTHWGRSTKCSGVTRTCDYTYLTGLLAGTQCDNSYRSKGLCSGHYDRQRKGYDMDATWMTFDSSQGCKGTVEGEPCPKPHHCKGYCEGHYARHKVGGDMDRLFRIHDPGRGCSAKGCKKKHYAKGICRTHYKIGASHRRRALEVGAEGTHTPAEWEACQADWCHRCAYGVLFPDEAKCEDYGKTYEGKLTVGHVIPLTREGSNYITNIWPICGQCNSSQNSRLLEEWLEAKRNEA